VDDLGREVTFPARPARVLALAPSLTEIVYALGGDVPAVSPVDDYPPAVTSLPRFSTFPLDHEGVVALEPDLLLATDQVNRLDDAEALAAAGVPTYFFRLRGPADVPRVLRDAGRLLGLDGEAPARAFEARMAEVAAAVAGAPRPRVLMLVGDETPYAFGLATEMAAAAGGESVTAGLGDAGAVLSEEWVVARAPEVVVLLIDPYDPADLVRHHPSWAGLPAVRAGRVHGLDPDLASRPGPRMAEGVARLARLLHPDRFAPAP
jgi:iron complex transport system substrate-binding protein